ncbi:MAG: metallophosphoesterase [Muribaculaceae bacterium]|nr:metallophosphoesterase [Muribaculaceae bacterium]
MTIGILHLSDLHIKSDSAFWDSKPSQIVSATRNDFHSCDKLFVVCTGDIAFSGCDEEYMIAHKFFNALKSLLNQIHANKCSEIVVIVPGNHDCDFSKESQLRGLVLNNLSYENLNKDNSVTNNALEVQANFFDFLNLLNGSKIDNKLAYKYCF